MSELPSSDPTSTAAANLPVYPPPAQTFEENGHATTAPEPLVLVGDTTRPVDVLVIGPHPDDVELTASGLLLKAKDAGYRTAAIELTAGEMGTRGTVEKRREELKRAAEILQLDYRAILGMRDGGVRPEPIWIEALVRQIRLLNPRIVVIPPKHDDDHPDHWHASRLCWEACHFATKIKYLPGVPVAERLSRVMMSMYRRYADPDIVMDVSDVMPRCLEAIGVFHTQYGRDPEDASAPATYISNPSFTAWWSGRRSFLGSMIGTAYGEGYFVEGPVRLDDPIGIFGGTAPPPV